VRFAFTTSSTSFNKRQSIAGIRAKTKELEGATIGCLDSTRTPGLHTGTGPWLASPRAVPGRSDCCLLEEETTFCLLILSKKERCQLGLEIDVNREIANTSDSDDVRFVIEK
jgi:hypothetical protein